jgi:membrane protease YdiL (CAAX protease family)
MDGNEYEDASEPALAREVAIHPLDANRALLFVLIAPSLLLGLFTALFSTGWAIALAGLATLLLLFALFRDAMRALLDDPWLRTAPRLGLVLGVALLAFFASRGVSVFMASVAPGLLEAAPEYEALIGTAGALELALTFLGIAVFVPLYEELVFRGLALRAYGQARGYLFAALFTAFLFAMLHVLPAQVFPILPLGFILARAVQSGGGFWTAVLVHMLNNGLALGALVYLERAGELAEQAAPEAVPLGVGLFGLAITVLCLWLAVRWLAVPNEGARRGGPLLSGSLYLVLALSVASLIGVLLGVGEVIGLP